MARLLARCTALHGVFVDALYGALNGVFADALHGVLLARCSQQNEHGNLPSQTSFPGLCGSM